MIMDSGKSTVFVLLMSLLSIETIVAYPNIVYGECNATHCNSTTIINNTTNVTYFPNFMAHHDTMTCSNATKSTPFNAKLQGVNLGGWMELEPWITPSLFYQFIGGQENDTAMDTYTFCHVLGTKEANKQLHRHWKSWVNESHIQELATMGVDTIRFPVGDFIFNPYGPYVGCVDGGIQYVDQFLSWANASGIQVFFDIHCHIGSQNGFDNSGQARRVEWTSNKTSYPPGMVTFEHWPVRSADWIGPFNTYNLTYPVINYQHIQHSLDTIRIIAERYKDHPAVLGLEPINEPFEQSPLPVLKQFYWDGYMIVKQIAPQWKYIIHDSFRFQVDVWGGFMAGCPDRVLDTHIYLAWNDPGPRENFYDNACASRKGLAEMEIAFGPVIVGEWSIATDNCVMWQNGFNDDIPGYPKLACKYISCEGPSYLGPDQPGTPLNKTKPLQGPYGTGSSGPVYAMCPVGRDWFKEGLFREADFLNLPPKAPPSLDDTKTVRRSIAQKSLESFSFTHGNMFWNFRTELYEPTWSFPDAVKAGYMPTGQLETEPMKTTCNGYRNGTYVCVCRSGQPKEAILEGISYVYQFENKPIPSWVTSTSGFVLEQKASAIFTKFFDQHRLDGATCDFGGVATLQYVNMTATPSDEGHERLVRNVLWTVSLVFVGVVVLVSLIVAYVRRRGQSNIGEEDALIKR